MYLLYHQSFKIWRSYFRKSCRVISEKNTKTGSSTRIAAVTGQKSISSVRVQYLVVVWGLSSPRICWCDSLINLSTQNSEYVNVIYQQTLAFQLRTVAFSLSLSELCHGGASLSLSLSLSLSPWVEGFVCALKPVRPIQQCHSLPVSLSLEVLEREGERKK